jgi:hypothetical protein
MLDTATAMTTSAGYACHGHRNLCIYGLVALIIMVCLLLNAEIRVLSITSLPFASIISRPIGSSSVSIINSRTTSQVQVDFENASAQLTTLAVASHFEDLPRVPPPGPSCFLHVGKAGGSSVACLLGVRTPHCAPGSTMWNKLSGERNVSAIAKQVARGGDIHMDHGRCPRTTTAYLVPIRNPVERIYSWFYFERILEAPTNRTSRAWPRKFLFVDCYAHLEDLAMDGLSQNVSDQIIPADVIEMTCPQRAWAGILGSRTVGVHNWYNYEYYHDMITQPTRLFVLRTEHLVQDWDTVEKMFGGNGTSDGSLFGVKVNANTRGQKKKVLSEAALKYICRALCPEIQYYKRFLLEAENLDSKQVAMSILELRDTCPQETVEIQACEGIPDFPRSPENSVFMGLGKQRLKCDPGKRAEGTMPPC